MKKVVCLICNTEFITTGARHLYCGSWKRKLGCSWIRHKENNKRANKKYYELKPLTKEERHRRYKRFYTRRPKYFTLESRAKRKNLINPPVE